MKFFKPQEKNISKRKNGMGSSTQENESCVFWGDPEENIHSNTAVTLKVNLLSLSYTFLFGIVFQFACAIRLDC